VLLLDEQPANAAATNNTARRTAMIFFESFIFLSSVKIKYLL
jgi:hypothetical protein